MSEFRPLTGVAMPLLRVDRRPPAGGHLHFSVLVNRLWWLGSALSRVVGVRKRTFEVFVAVQVSWGVYYVEIRKRSSVNVSVFFTYPRSPKVKTSLSGIGTPGPPAGSQAV